ncbi:MAG: HIT domain-containing protein, partial [Cytophagia bacterium]|nr:HIT domain-containing protein [Cytophagia bacterium]
MLLKTLTVIILIIALPICSMAQSENYTVKKDSAIKTISPFEIMAEHPQKDVKLAYEDKDLMAFEPIRKQAPVHLLIVPKKRIYTLNETQAKDEQLLGKMILVAKDMARKKGIDKTGYRLAINTNEDAGQSVFQIHLHLLGGTNLGPMVDQGYKKSLFTKQLSDKQQIEQLLQTFASAIEKKDTTTLLSLFVDVPVNLIGARASANWKNLKTIRPNETVNVYERYDSWVKEFMDHDLNLKKFTNIFIEENGLMGSVTFDYAFWGNQKKKNYVKESWELIKINEQWKIASMLFSTESETFKLISNQADVEDEVKQIRIEKYLQSLMDSAIFQGTVLIAKQDSIIHHAAYGMFDVENKIPNTIHTQFLIGSLTKSFVATAIMQLVEKGLVDLHAPVQQYIPNLKNELAKDLTVHHLLKQQSGLAVYIDDLTDVEVMDIMPSEILDIINKSKRSFKPGAKFEYSNLNYNLLAMVIEQVSGKSYQTFLQENLFEPAGMGSSGIERLLNIPSNRAIGYRMVNDKFRRIQNVVSYAFGTGDMYATTMDLYKWSNALHKGKLISKASTDKMFDGGTKDWGYYGYGFRKQPYQRGADFQIPGTLIRHGG